MGNTRLGVGARLGPYLLKRSLGRGGMGEVFEAENTEMDRVVALKLMSAVYGQDADFRERLQREARIAGRLQEPHVVPIHGSGEIDGHLFVDMRLIDGKNLDSQLKSYGPLTPARAVAILRQIASALDAAHAAGVMHRDIKPANILITKDDFAYLVDFGIANAVGEKKLTQQGDVMGTWTYMAPERFTSGRDVSFSVDIYALACVLFESLTGAPPYGGTRTTLLASHLYDPVPRPSQRRPGIPAAFDEVIAHGMAKNPEERYASAGDLGMAAQEALSTPDRDRAESILRRSQVMTIPSSTPLPGSMPSRPTQKLEPPQQFSSPRASRPRAHPAAAYPPNPPQPGSWPQSQPPSGAPPAGPSWPSQPSGAPPAGPSWPSQPSGAPPAGPSWAS
ncbi:MAG: serine/threonine protein kinase, partial [Mycobacteriaceae bacterium]|nr:serine/threonine protein kinase [Mycobacteriaceae bacterium]